MRAIIRPESSGDIAAIREVNCQAFGGEDEARLVDRLRDGGFATISLVALADGEIVGHILFSDLTIESSHGTAPALALAPLAVLPGHQRQGIGSALVREGLRTAESCAHRIVLVLGDPAYYERFGFSADIARLLRSQYSGPHFMALTHKHDGPDELEGEVIYSPPFQAL